MAQGLTLEQLQKMGAKPVQQGEGLTLEQIKSQQSTSNPIPQQDKRSLADKIWSGIETAGKITNAVFPGKQVGDAIGTLAGATIANFKGQGDQYDLSAPTPLQVGGDIASGVATLAGFKGVGTTGSVLSKMGKSAVLGAGQFGGKTAAEGGSAGDIVKSSAIGAGVGAGTSAVMSGAEVLAKNFQKIPSRLINSATGQSKKEILAGKGLDKFILENKKVGTADKLIRDSKDQMEKLSNIINNNLKSIPITKAKITTSSILDDLVKGVNSDGGSITKAEAKEIIDRLAPQAKGLLSKPSMSLVTANKLRQSIDRTIGDKGFLLSELPFNKDILRNFTNALREQVKVKAPDGTRAAFNSLSNEIRLSNALTQKMAQGSRNQIISFGDLIGGGIGGAVGGIPGAMAGAAARRVVQSTPFLTGMAVSIDTLQKNLAPILSGFEPTIQTAIIKAINEAANSK